MKHIKYIIYLFLPTIVFLTSCGNKNEIIFEPLRQLKIEENKVMTVGETIRLTVQTIPEKPTEDFKTGWTSSDSSIVDINNGDELIAITPGVAIITIQVVGKESISAQCKITVNADMTAIVDFEDQTFKNLVLLDYDINQDGELQNSEALRIKKLLIGGQGIKSLKGIEALINLEELLCARNFIKTLDLSKNIQLKIIDCNENRIEKLNVSKLNNLEELYCRANRLSELDVTKNPALRKLSIEMNLGNGTNHNGIRRIDVTQNKELEYLNAYFLNISELDVTQNRKLKWLDFSLSGYGNTSEFQPITNIDLSNNVLLEHLSCGGWMAPGKCLQSLDVSNCPELKTITCMGNSIKSLDLSNNKKLINLNVAYNPLEALDISNNVLLESLYCDRAKIKKLDLTKNEKLKTLRCAHNEIDKLDISNTQMSYLDAEYNKIHTINVGEKVFSTPDHKGKPYLYMKLNNNNISEIDIARQQNLAWIEIKNNNLTTFDVSGCSNLGGVLCQGNNISKLSLGRHSRMWELHVADNNLSGTLNISHLNNLGKASFENNPKLRIIHLAKNIDPDCEYLLAGAYISAKTLPCYTKDSSAQWKQ